MVTRNANGGIQKVQIRRKDGNGPWLTVVDTTAQFNPEKLQYSKKASWKTEKTWKSNIGNTTFTGGNPIMLSVDLFFDTTMLGGDVRVYTDSLLDLAMGNPDEQKTLSSEKDLKSQLANLKKQQDTWKDSESPDEIKNLILDPINDKVKTLENRMKGLGAGSKGAPPKCQFIWGTFSFICIVESVNITFIMFLADGTPVRARAKVKMKQIEEGALYAPQNPTSRSAARKIWIVEEGQTLDWIAYQEYGDPSLWRHIAEKNDLDNPLDIKPGQILNV